MNSVKKYKFKQILFRLFAKVTFEGKFIFNHRVEYRFGMNENWWFYTWISILFILLCTLLCYVYVQHRSTKLVRFQFLFFLNQFSISRGRKVFSDFIHTDILLNMNTTTENNPIDSLVYKQTKYNISIIE